MHDLIDQAINLALSGNWTQAIEVNQEILLESPTDIAALNRLARAYGELGDKENAKITYQKVLKLDKYNSIATKSLRLLPHLNGACQDVTDENFIETPGITKTISLVKIGSRETLAGLCTKQKITLVDKGLLLSAITVDKCSIGCLPDDLSFKIKKLLAKGYEYHCCVKSVSDNAVTIFVREFKRPNRPGYTATFSKTQTYSKLKK